MCFKWIYKCDTDPRAAHPTSICLTLIAAAARGAVAASMRRLVDRLHSHTLTWFVTSSVVGLYVVMPCVPTEKTRLYLEHKAGWVRHAAHLQSLPPLANESSAYNSTDSQIRLAFDVGGRINMRVFIFNSEKLKINWIWIFIAPNRRTVVKEQQINFATTLIMSQRRVTSWGSVSRWCHPHSGL